ncbi:NUDIX domain-containing protein [Ramlibacter sp.]|uniref:NUDIX domain-containing protein n=1 Tax=Ramlibacter sp. TaxID=1917967 RepID=UPI002C849163|nr:NUDIX domain-containing protein [Ramlibacter sp.]HWI82215.1 NUDIX domain-containing protein [Ramlibacter sp.]
MTAPPPPRPAATVVVVRDAPHGLELLLLRRAEKGDHNSCAWVFPGGLLDAGDRHCHDACVGLDDRAASALLGVPHGGLDHFVASIRECFEEAGILFAVDERGQPIDMLVDAGTRLGELRAPLHRGEVAFADICRDFGLRLAADQLFYIAHWITPPGRAKRFDTRFFLAVLPAGQSSAHDALETVDHVWLRPADALSSENSRRLMTPTRAVIGMIGRFADTRALLAWARSPREVPTVAPRLGVDRHGVRPVPPHEPAWAELGLLDPQGHGTAWCELRPDVPVRLTPRVARIASADGGNTYVVGSGDDWAAIDPAAADQAHLDAVLAAAGGRIGTILLTGAADAATAAWRDRTGAGVREAAPGDAVVLGGDCTLQVLAPFDRARSGRRYLLVQDQMLVGGTVADAALPALAERGIEWVAPARGFLVATKGRTGTREPAA